METGTCARLVNDAFEIFEKNSQMTTIVLATMGPVYLTGEAFKAFGRERTRGMVVRLINEPQVTDKAVIFERGMHDTFKRLTALNKRVIFVIDNPELGFGPSSCVEKNI